MKNKRSFKYIKLFAGSLALVSTLSACSKTNTNENTPQIVYVYVTATPTPIPEVLTTEPSVFETTPTTIENDGWWAEDSYIFQTTPTENTQSTTQTIVNDGWWAEDAYIFNTVSQNDQNVQPVTDNSNTDNTTPTTTQPTEDDGWWALNDEERQFWSNFNARQAEINNAIDNFSWAEARENAINRAKTLIDFIFYGGTLNGMTFEELTMVGRLEVYARLQALDSRIMEFYPDYKTDLGELYSRVRSFASTTYERAREIFSGQIDIDINVYTDGTSQSTMNASREIKELKLKK